MRFVGTRDFVEHDLGLGDMLAEEPRHLLDGVDVLADDFARLGGDLFAPPFVLRHVLHDGAGEFAAGDREDTHRHDAVAPMLAVFDDFAAVVERTGEEVGELGKERVDFKPFEIPKRLELLERARKLRENPVAFADRALAVDDDDAGGDVADERVGSALEIPLEVGVAHRFLGLARNEGLGEFAAGGVTARAAVELVGFGDFADPRERVGHEALFRLVFHHRRRRIGGNAAVREVAPDARLQRRGLVRGEKRIERTAALGHRRSVHAAAGTGEDFKKNLSAVGAGGERSGIDAV